MEIFDQLQTKEKLLSLYLENIQEEDMLLFGQNPSRDKFLRNCFVFTFLMTHVEVPEITNSEQRCFRELTFFSADSLNMKRTSAN